jgi:hypothetical protein
MKQDPVGAAAPLRPMFAPSPRLEMRAVTNLSPIRPSTNRCNPERSERISPRRSALSTHTFPQGTKYPPHLRSAHHRRRPELVSSRSFGGEHDSTGLRAKQKLKHTALAVRVAQKHALFPGASETTQQNKNGEPPGSPFYFPRGKLSLFVAQRQHRIDSCGAPRRNVARHKRDASK